MKTEIIFVKNYEYYALHSVFQIVTELSHDDTNELTLWKKRERRKLGKILKNEKAQERNIQEFEKYHKHKPSVILRGMLLNRAKTDNNNRRN